ncbi:putative bifunctional diguanylate cyclase/phosphodiesterase [Jatrophihabitans sp. DSM 45814]
MTLSARSDRTANPVRRLFAVYALVSLIPVLVLGATLLVLFHVRSDTLGAIEGRSRAQQMARIGIAPLLDGHDLRQGLAPDETAALERTANLAVQNKQILGLQLRDLDGRLIYSNGVYSNGAFSNGAFSNGVSSTGAPLLAQDRRTVKAASGSTLSKLDWLGVGSHEANADTSRGPRVLEVYQPLQAAQSNTRIGVVEMALPYAPIATDLAHNRIAVVYAISAGLTLMWLCLIGVSISVTRRLRRQMAANQFLATHDALTSMPNRAEFIDRAARAVANATSERPAAIAIIDLDRFKEVNDTLGHGVGDRLLVMLADRLKLYVREGDIIARLGGDEFGVVLSGVRNAGEAVEVLARLRGIVNEPLEINGLPLAVEASIGFALAPDDGDEFGALIQRADLAMYVAKRQRVGIAHFRPEHDQYESSALTLAAELGAAIAHDELVLHYQPKVDLRGKQVTAVETLVRWQHPTRGLLYPDAFLPAAEQTELIEQLTHWVLRTATSALQAIDPGGNLAVAVNISAHSLARSGFAQDVLDILAETRTDPSRIILEITETALMVDPPLAARLLAELHAAGIRISIDDFGAGQTSLGYLATLPISELKIDKTFVLSMLTDDRNFAIVRSVIELGHALGFTVTAEGVETIDALDNLAALRCDTVQGYLLARPSAAIDLAEGLAAAVRMVTAHHLPQAFVDPKTAARLTAILS